MESLFNHANGNNIYIDAREPTHKIQVLKNNCILFRVYLLHYMAVIKGIITI